MTKSQTLKIVVLCVAITWVFDIFAGRFLTAKISTWPLLNRWHILSPDAPIVINNRETVRVEGNGDTIQAAAGVKSKISALVSVNSRGDAVEAATINLTSDGGFVTGAGVFSKNLSDYYVVLNDGRTGKITSSVLDPATSLTFFKADLGNVPAANLASSGDVKVGEKVLFVSNSLQNFTGRAAFGFVNSGQDDIQGQVLQSDYPRRSFGSAAPGPLLSGQALADVNSDIIGIWNGSAVISSDVLKQAMSLYFAGGGKISRPSFGFSYSIITKAESALAGLPGGAEVKAVIKPSPALAAGLLENDVITDVDGNKISERSPLEEILQRYKPGDIIRLNVVRGKDSISMTLTVGELK